MSWRVSSRPTSCRPPVPKEHQHTWGIICYTKHDVVNTDVGLHSQLTWALADLVRRERRSIETLSVVIFITISSSFSVVRGTTDTLSGSVGQYRLYSRHINTRHWRYPQSDQTKKYDILLKYSYLSSISLVLKILIFLELATKVISRLWQELFNQDSESKKLQVNIW